MRFVFGKQDMLSLDRTQERCWLLPNGLGGYMSTSSAFSVTRWDQGLLTAAISAPTVRVNLVHRLSEELTVGEKRTFLSTQTFAGGASPEEGWKNLSAFVWDGVPAWLYHVDGVQVKRQCAMAYGENLSAVVYEVENRSRVPCVLRVRPLRLSHDRELYLRTGGTLEETGPVEEAPAYPDDAKDGRRPSAKASSRSAVTWTVAPGTREKLELVFSDTPTERSGWDILSQAQERLRTLDTGFRTPEARQLAQSASAFVTRRDSTRGMTIVAGYPFFGDWGRDTMIALPGCLLSTGRFEEAKSVLRTFLAYEREGLVPNLFPEGGAEPRYNTADAALLLVNCVWLYFQKTGDSAFIREALPVLERIIAAYRRGTRHAIKMDAGGLISAGEGSDQVTWMDVCVDGHLPTPRHGKPVEINAYWYNALCILRELSSLTGADGEPYAVLAEQVKSSFNRKFWMEEKGYLRDVLSGTAEEEQLRCNQIWAVSLPFTMLSPERERLVVDAVYRHLYTPCGLRTLATEDRAFHPVYQGEQQERDLAYHQGTVWPFSLGAYYLAYLKTRGNSIGAARAVREQLAPMESSLREGCVGQIPEVYDGGVPGMSKGCFAQAWSVGELLRVYEKLEEIEENSHVG